jgi:hypothetical protein
MEELMKLESGAQGRQPQSDIVDAARKLADSVLKSGGWTSWVRSLLGRK